MKIKRARTTKIVFHKKKKFKFEDFKNCLDETQLKNVKTTQTKE